MGLPDRHSGRERFPKSRWKVKWRSRTGSRPERKGDIRYRSREGKEERTRTEVEGE